MPSLRPARHVLKAKMPAPACVQRVRSQGPTRLHSAPKLAMTTSPGFSLRRIGVIRSTLQSIDAAPCQGDEGAPDAWLEIEADYARALAGVAAGDPLILVTWLHLASRDVLEVHPRGDRRNPR